MYNEIIKVIETEQAKVKNILFDRCANGMEAAIKEMDVLSGTIFVKTLLGTTLVQSKGIVDKVKAGALLYDAYCTCTTP